MKLKQLEQTSDFVNKTYNLDTWVNEQTKSIWATVWNQSFTDTYDIEMSKEQLKDLMYKEEIWKEMEKNLKYSKTTNQINV